MDRTMNYTQMLVGLLAVAALWDIGRRWVRALGANAALIASVEEYSKRLATSDQASAHEISSMESRVATLEGQVRGVKNHLETIRAPRPWAGSKVPRIGA
jgi:hypothetical protein